MPIEIRKFFGKKIDMTFNNSDDVKFVDEQCQRAVLLLFYRNQQTKNKQTHTNRLLRCSSLLLLLIANSLKNNDDDDKLMMNIMDKIFSFLFVCRCCCCVNFIRTISFITFYSNFQ